MKKDPSFGYAKPEEIAALKALCPSNRMERARILNAIARRTAKEKRNAKAKASDGGAS